jgi:hypothetical protein
MTKKSVCRHQQQQPNIISTRIGQASVSPLSQQMLLVLVNTHATDSNDKSKKKKEDNNTYME